jgi:hypothetical protein
MKVALFEFEGTLDAQEQILRQRMERKAKGWDRKTAEDAERLMRVQREKARTMKRDAVAYEVECMDDFRPGR